MTERLKKLLRQCRPWFSPHPTRRDAVSVCFPKAEEVNQWMRDTDHALLDEDEPLSIPSPPDAQLSDKGA